MQSKQIQHMLRNPRALMNFQLSVFGPAGRWQEADLDYRGGKRNAKRLVFAGSGRRFGHG